MNPKQFGEKTQYKNTTTRQLRDGMQVICLNQGLKIEDAFQFAHDLSPEVIYEENDGTGTLSQWVLKESVVLDTNITTNVVLTTGNKATYLRPFGGSGAGGGSTTNLYSLTDSKVGAINTIIVKAGDTLTYTLGSNIESEVTKVGTAINLKLKAKNDFNLTTSTSTGDGVVINFANHQNAGAIAYRLDNNINLPTITLTDTRKVEFIANFDLDSEPTGWTSDLAAIMTVLFINNVQDQYGDIVEFAQKTVNILPSGTRVVTDMHNLTAIFYKTLTPGTYSFDIRALPWINSARTPVGTLTNYGYTSSAKTIN